MTSLGIWFWYILNFYYIKYEFYGHDQLFIQAYKHIIMPPVSLQCLSRNVVLRHVYYVNTPATDSVIAGLGLISRKDILKILDSPYLMKEVTRESNKYFMAYLFENPRRGVLYAARYGVLSLFELFKNHYLLTCTKISIFFDHEYHHHLHYWPEIFRYAYQHNTVNVHVTLPSLLQLSTVAAIGGNIDIVKHVCAFEDIDVDYYDMIMGAIGHGHIDVVEFCLDNMYERKIYANDLIENAIDMNAPTTMLLMIFARSTNVFFIPKFSFVPVGVTLMTELGFRRVINYHDMIFPDHFKRYEENAADSKFDLCKIWKNIYSYNTNFNEVNLLFIYALYNDIFVTPEKKGVADYAMAFAAVCISKKSSMNIFERLLTCMEREHYDPYTPCIHGVAETCNKIYKKAIEYIIYSMNTNIRT
jgi:hypothetical protein